MQSWYAWNIANKENTDNEILNIHIYCMNNKKKLWQFCENVSILNTDIWLNLVQIKGTK